MKQMLRIGARETLALIATPTAWGLATLFQVLGGFLFTYVLIYSKTADLSPLYLRLVALLVLLMPMVTSGRIAQERRQGTMELLLTSPVSPASIVGGKFLAMLVFVGMLTVLSLQYPFVMEMYADADAGQWVPATVGFFLVGSLLGAVGLAASSVTSNPVLAGVLGLTGSLFLWWGHLPGQFLGIAGLTDGFSILTRFMRLNRGVVDGADLYAFAAGTLFFLGLAARGVESDRW